jgi:hypothetical protein
MTAAAMATTATVEAARTTRRLYPRRFETNAGGADRSVGRTSRSMVRPPLQKSQRLATALRHESGRVERYAQRAVRPQADWRMDGRVSVQAREDRRPLLKLGIRSARRDVCRQHRDRSSCAGARQRWEQAPCPRGAAGGGRKDHREARSGRSYHCPRVGGGLHALGQGVQGDASRGVVRHTSLVILCTATPGLSAERARPGALASIERGATDESELGFQ